MLQGTRQTTAPKEKLRAGSPPRQPKPTGKAAEKLLARKKMLVLCDLPKRGDARPVRTPLTGLRVDRCAVTRPACLSLIRLPWLGVEPSVAFRLMADGWWFVRRGTRCCRRSGTPVR